MARVLVLVLCLKDCLAPTVHPGGLPSAIVPAMEVSKRCVT